MKNFPKILYISTDGILEPLGYSQVFSYVKKLSTQYSIFLFTLENAEMIEKSDKVLLLKKDLKKKKIKWIYLKYSKNIFLRHFINNLKIFLLNFYFLIKYRPQIVHIRSYMPGVSIPILSLFFKFKLIFDMRGFWADEKIDRLNWSNKSLKYLFFKILEKYLLKRSDSIITLTHSAAQYLKKQFNIDKNKITIIRTCVDLKRFKLRKIKRNKNIIKIGYLGSADTAYDFKKFIYFANVLKKNFRNYKIKLVILTRSDRVQVLKKIKDLLDPDIKYLITFLENHHLSKQISTCNFICFFIKKGFSSVASMPTKIAESLACGVPIVCNNFNSDIRYLFLKYKIGYLYNQKKYINRKKIKSIIFKNNFNREKLNKFAEHFFSLEVGYKKYLKIYNDLSK